jgi:ssDNA-binding Zn-finger/Zn-ribbon topoisomerase 1
LITKVNANIAWYKLLPLLGVTVDAGSLPARVQCPLCDGELDLYQDSTYGGTWHHCLNCQSTGDMIELAAKKWNTDCQTTLISLERHGFSMRRNASTLDSYQQTLNLRERMRKYHSDAGVAMSQNPSELHPQLQKCDLIQGLRPAVWQPRMGKFVGCSDYQDAQRMFRPAAKGKTSMTNGYTCLFRGKMWKHVFAIPYQDLPGHYSGWLFIGRGCAPEDYAFRPLNDDRNAKSTPMAEAGLAMFDVLYQQTYQRELFGKAVFVFEDVLLALKLQSIHMKHHGVPLPLVATYTGTVQNKSRQQLVRSREVWKVRPNRPYIFWHSKFSVHTINNASRCHGRVQFCDRFHRETTWNHRWLAAAQQEAVPWQTALQDHIDTLSDPELGGLLPQLELDAEAKQLFLHGCSSHTRDRLLRVWGQNELLRTAIVNGTQVSETPDGWFNDKNGNRISDTKIRIDQAIYNITAEKIFYRGRAIHRNGTLEFLEEEAKIGANTFRWLMESLVAAGIGMPTCTHSWRTSLLDLATAFHSPDVLRTTGSFGWDSEQGRFVLPQFSITKSGQTVEESTPVIDNLAPAVNIAPPGMVPPRLDLLTDDNPINKIYWAMSAAIAANIVAPAKNQPTAGIGLIGPGASIVGRMAGQVWGCCTFAPFKSIRRPAAVLCEDTAEATHRHRWPLILITPATKQKQKLSGWLNSVDDKNAILDVDRTLADALGTQANWRFLVDDTKVLSAPTVLEHGGAAAIGWLKYFCSRELQLPDEGTLLNSVLHSMAEWVGSRGNPEVVLSAIDLLDDATEDGVAQAQRFAALLYRFVSNGALTVAHIGYTAGGKMDMVEFDGSGEHPPGMFVRRHIVNKLLANHGIPLPDPVQITQVLAKAGALECEIDYDGYGWLIRKDWWESQLAFFRDRQHRILRVVQ